MRCTWVFSAVLSASLGFSAVSYAEMVVIASAQSEIAPLDLQQVKNLYLGKSSQTAKGVTVIPLDNGEKSEKEFYKKIAHHSLKTMRTLWSKAIADDRWQPPKQLMSDKEMLDVVGKNPNTLGYVDKASVDSTVKVVLSLH